MASVMVMGEEAHEALTAAEQLRAAAPRMLAVASVILGNPHDAEDAVQDAMLAAWRHWDQLRDPSRRAAWLMRICVRESLRHGRLRAVLGRREVGVRHEPALTTPDGDSRRWDEAFASLSRQQRAVVVLHYQYGYTLDECSVLMRCRPGSARQHLARALRRLRESWND